MSKNLDAILALIDEALESEFQKRLEAAIAEELKGPFVGLEALK